MMKCYIRLLEQEELKEWDQCLLMLGEAKVDEYGNFSDTKDSNAMHLDKDSEDREINISSAICFLRGKTYEALENRSQARQWYKAAIRADPLCYEFEFSDLYVTIRIRIRNFGYPEIRISEISDSYSDSNIQFPKVSDIRISDIRI
ncbi:hypothetical protein LXL04_002344 [Taraxacum kok-saghyz]